MLAFQEAYPIAERLRERFAPVCEPGRCVIAGSLRRHASAIEHAETRAIAETHQVALVKDIELVVYPLPGKTMFGEATYERTPLYDLVGELLAEGALVWPDDKKDGPRQKKLMVPASADHGSVMLDLFICFPPSQWGYQIAIRTGPWQYSKWLVTKRKWGGGLPTHLVVQDAGLHSHGQLIETPTEEKFFETLGLIVPLPHERVEEG